MTTPVPNKIRPIVVRLPEKLADARIAALEECAEHLGMAWTDNKDELAQGNLLAEKFREMIDALGRKATSNIK
jgi:hypothetical protein